MNTESIRALAENITPENFEIVMDNFRCGWMLRSMISDQGRLIDRPKFLNRLADDLDGGAHPRFAFEWCSQGYGLISKRTEQTNAWREEYFKNN